MGDIEIKSYIIPKSSLYGFNHTFNAKYDNIHVHKYNYFLIDNWLLSKKF